MCNLVIPFNKEVRAYIGKCRNTRKGSALVESVLDTGATVTTMNIKALALLMDFDIENVYNRVVSVYRHYFACDKILDRQMNTRTANGIIKSIPMKIRNIMIENVTFNELFFRLNLVNSLEQAIQSESPLILLGMDVILSGEDTILRADNAVIHNLDSSKYYQFASRMTGRITTLYLNEAGDLVTEQESFQPDQILILDSKPIGVQDASSDIISAVGEYNTEYKTGIAEEESSAGKRLKTAFDKMDVLMEELIKDISNSNDSTEE